MHQTAFSCFDRPGLSGGSGFVGTRVGAAVHPPTGGRRVATPAPRQVASLRAGATVDPREVVQPAFGGRDHACGDPSHEKCSRATG